MENIFTTDKDLLHKCFIKYVTLMNDFLNYGYNNLDYDNINNYKNNIYKGYQTLTHVFKYIILKTYNINFAYEITQKCFLYYIEFISQIYDTNNQYINLSITDAIFFIYKKSIFKDLDEDKNIDNNTTTFLPLLNKLIIIHNELLTYYIDNLNSNTINFTDFTKQIYILTENLLTIDTVNNIDNIIVFVQYCKTNNIHFNVVISNLIILIKTLSNKNIDSDNLFLSLTKINFAKLINNNKITNKTFNAL